MARYKIFIDRDALHDIQLATDWYNERIIGLGSRFQKQVITQINSLKTNPLLYSRRYAEIHCMLIKKFPFFVHFKIDEKAKQVEIFAVFHTSRNPEIWLLRTLKK